MRIILHKANVYCPCQGTHKDTGMEQQALFATDGNRENEGLFFQL